MSDPQVPGEDGPAQMALRMRASDAERERVVDVLREAYAQGRLTQAEHEERVAAAYAAATYADLIPVLADLPVPPGTLPNPSSSAATPPALPGPVLATDREGAGDGTAVAVFGQFVRRGAWTVPAHLNANAVFGEGTLDFTQAVLTSRETVVQALALFGAVKVLIPAGIAVRNEAVAVLGSVDMPHDPGPIDGPVIIIRGAAILGAIEIRR